MVDIAGSVTTPSATGILIVKLRSNNVRWDVTPPELSFDTSCLPISQVRLSLNCIRPLWTCGHNVHHPCNSARLLSLVPRENSQELYLQAKQIEWRQLQVQIIPSFWSLFWCGFVSHLQWRVSLFGAAVCCHLKLQTRSWCTSLFVGKTMITMVTKLDRSFRL